MLHGMAAGNAFFCLNYDHLAKDRKVYGLDLPGMLIKIDSNKTGVINDPLDQPQVAIFIFIWKLYSFCWILKSWTDGQHL